MSGIGKVVVSDLAPAQAIELSLLVDLEAHWENLRKAPSLTAAAGSALQTLVGVQKAYDAFRSKLGAYNKRYLPAHVPELLLNTPARLGEWCRIMRDLYLQVEQDPRGRCPVHLLEKAYRRADGVSVRLHKDRIRRSAPRETIRAAIEDLGALVQWCDAFATTN